MTEERVQKALARLGFGSRREIEGFIEQGLVRINGEVAAIGARVKDGDRVQLHDRTAVIRPEKQITRVLIYNKPEGEICTRKDPEGRRTVYQSLPGIRGSRWVNIGRLDINTSGLLLFTTNGELANRMMHPSYEIDREYAVRVNGDVTDEIVDRLTRGVRLEDGMAKFEVVEYSGGQGRNHWYHVIIKEGRNREVRRLWEAVGCKVSRLTRVRYGEWILPRNLRQGRFVELDNEEIERMAAAVGLEVDVPVRKKLARKGADKPTRKATGKGTGRPTSKKAVRKKAVKKFTRKKTNYRRK